MFKKGGDVVKKIVSILIIIMMLSLTLASCDGEGAGDTDGKIHIVSTIFPGYDFLRQITDGAEDMFEITMLLPPGSESHDYEASVSDLALVEKASLIISVGGETDAWVDDVIRASGSRAKVIKMTELVPLYHEDEGGILEGHSHEHHDHGEECEGGHGEADEHVWTSPRNGAVIAESIGAELCKLFPERAELFNRNTENFCAELNTLADEMQSVVDGGALDTLVFADRFPFRYLTEELGLQYRAAFSGCSSTSEPSLSTIYRITEYVKKENVPAVLTVEFSSGGAAKVIAEETGAEVYTLHSCHNLSAEDFSAGVTYLDVMRNNLEVLKRALCE